MEENTLNQEQQTIKDEPKRKRSTPSEWMSANDMLTVLGITSLQALYNAVEKGVVEKRKNIYNGHTNYRLKKGEGDSAENLLDATRAAAYLGLPISTFCLYRDRGFIKPDVITTRKFYKKESLDKAREKIWGPGANQIILPKKK